MKFNKQMSNNTLSIPSGVFKISGFEADEKAEIHALDSAVVILKKRMTATELIQAMDALHQLATELTVHLAMVCGTCDDCEDGCPFDDLEDGMLELPDYLRREACIPAGAKLCAYADDEEQTVTIGVAHDGFGCRPHAIGRSIRCTCLGDEEMTRWNRTDFTGVLKEDFLPGWAREKLEELQGQNAGMGGMRMT